MFLEEIIIETEIKKYEKKLLSLYKKTRTLKEGVTDFHRDMDIKDMFDEALHRLSAAKRGLGIANRLDKPEDRKLHKSRVLKNLNKLRQFIMTLERQISSIPN